MGVSGLEPLIDPDGIAEAGAKRSVDPLESQLDWIMQTYRHHFDLFAKACMVFFVVCGAISSFALKEASATPARYLLLSLVALIGVFGFAMCLVSRRWVIELEMTVRELESKLSLGRFPFSGAKGVLTVMLVLTAVDAIASLLLIALLRA